MKSLALGVLLVLELVARASCQDALPDPETASAECGLYTLRSCSLVVAGTRFNALPAVPACGDTLRLDTLQNLRIFLTCQHELMSH